MNLTENDMNRIISQVVANIKNNPNQTSHTNHYTTGENFVKASTGQKGVFVKMEDALDAASTALTHFKKCLLKDREVFIKAIREVCLKQVEQIAKMTLEETKLGRYEDKVSKLYLVLHKTPGTEILNPSAYSGDDGLTIEEHAPFGVIGAITPVTNSVDTIINNSISMLAGGNTVVFNAHPSSKKSVAFVVDTINTAIVNAGGPENLVTMIKDPTKDSVSILTSDARVRLIVGTGGTEMVRTLLQSGKKTIGAGAGNPPVIVDETADLELAAQKIVQGAAFDNNILCIGEKEAFVLDSVADELIYHMTRNGAFFLDKEQEEKIKALVLENKSGYHTRKEWIGKDASLMLKAVGIEDKNQSKLLILDTDFNNPFVQLEQMMPVFPIVRVRSLDEAIEMAVKTEHGNRHTASMFSKNVENMTRFAKAIETTIFVKNSYTLSGVGFGGEGHTSMTLAGPTGEGITNAISFTRKRRCVLAEGGFRII